MGPETSRRPFSGSSVRPFWGSMAGIPSVGDNISVFPAASFPAISCWSLADLNCGTMGSLGPVVGMTTAGGSVGVAVVDDNMLLSMDCDIMSAFPLEVSDCKNYKSLDE